MSVDWRKEYESLVERLEASKSYPKPGPCGMSIEACFRHSIFRVDGSVVQDARRLLDEY